MQCFTYLASFTAQFRLKSYYYFIELHTIILHTPLFFFIWTTTGAYSSGSGGFYYKIASISYIYYFSTIFILYAVKYFEILFYSYSAVMFIYFYNLLALALYLDRSRYFCFLYYFSLLRYRFSKYYSCCWKLRVKSYAILFLCFSRYFYLGCYFFSSSRIFSIAHFLTYA